MGISKNSMRSIRTKTGGGSGKTKGSHEQPGKHWTSGLRLFPIGFVEPSSHHVQGSNLELMAIKGMINDLSFHPDGHEEIKKIVGLNTNQALASLLSSVSRLAVNKGTYVLEDRGAHRIPRGYLTWKSETDIQGHYILELKFIWNLRKSNPKLFKVLASLMHYLITKCKVCVFSEHLLYLVDPEREMCEDDEEDMEVDYSFQDCFREYDKGEPRRAAKFFKTMKPLSLSTIKAFKTKNQKLKLFIKDLVTAIESGVQAYDYQLDFGDNDEGSWLQECLYLGWDLDSEVEKNYCEYLNNTAGQLGVHAQYEKVMIQKFGWVPGEGLNKLRHLTTTLSNGFKLIQNIERIKN